MEYTTLFWILACLTFLVIGFWSGFVLHEQLMIQGMVKIAEGLEGTTFNIEVDFNETEITDKIIKFFNETIIKNNTQEGV